MYHRISSFSYVHHTYKYQDGRMYVKYSTKQVDFPYLVFSIPLFFMFINNVNIWFSRFFDCMIDVVNSEIQQLNWSNFFQTCHCARIRDFLSSIREIHFFMGCVCVCVSPSKEAFLSDTCWHVGTCFDRTIPFHQRQYHFLWKSLWGLVIGQD